MNIAARFERKDGADPAHLGCGLVELKFSGADEKEMTFSGYGAVFGNIDSYGDVIQKGAFADTLRRAKSSGQWPAMLMQHGGLLGAEMTPVGIWTDMHEDDTGLFVEGKLAPTPRGSEAYQLLKMTPRPAISGLSIGYLAKEWSVRTRPDEPRRTLKAVDLIEVSLVTNPANPKARVQAVKNDLTIRDAEKALRDVGFSQSDAKAIVASGFKALPQRDVERSGVAAAELGDLLASVQRVHSIFTKP
ncbi:HK97 family phage prohead protease [Azohydromonas lata]|uniref:HK97 family phage prohead protease n=1 Tax=Azohydromonas lata TaxID=45677 RepID=UPI0008376BD2|nr:HK97 family phage prohead protease [Azohydromonas lata]